MARLAIDLATGIIGLVFFAALFFVASWRLYTHLRRGGGFNAPKRFHVVTVLYAALDIPRYLWTTTTGVAVESQSGITARIVYACHLVSIWLHIVGLTIVILMWARVFSDKRSNKDAQENKSRQRNGFITQAIFALVNLVMLVFTVVLLINMLQVPRHVILSAALAGDPKYFPFVVASSSCLFFCGLGILAYGLKVRYEIAGHAWRPAAMPTVKKLLRSLNGTMAACTVMFALRIAMLLALFDARVRNNHIFNELEWHLLSYWLPTIVPAALLLYLMRGNASNRRRRQSLHPVDVRRPLFSNGVPHARSFSEDSTVSVPRASPADFGTNSSAAASAVVRDPRDVVGPHPALGGHRGPTTPYGTAVSSFQFPDEGSGGGSDFVGVAVPPYMSTAAGREQQQAQQQPQLSVGAASADTTSTFGYFE